MTRSLRGRKKPALHTPTERRGGAGARRGGATFRPEDFDRILRNTVTLAAAVFGEGHPFHHQAIEQRAAYLRRVGRDERADAISRAGERPRIRPRKTSSGRRPVAGPPAGRDASAPAVGPAVLDIRRAARYLTVSPETLYKLVRSGEIPHVRVGKSIRFRSDDIERFLEDRATRSWVRVDRRGRPPLRR